MWINWSQKYAFRKDLEELEAAIEDLVGTSAATHHYSNTA